MTAFLAAWVGLLGLAHSIAHAHAGGARPHSHNSSRPLAPPTGPSDVHRHLVLFGFDLGTAGLDVPLPTEDASPVADPGPVAPPVEPAALAEPPAPTQTEAPAPADLPPSVALCDFSRHALSGVRLI